MDTGITDLGWPPKSPDLNCIKNAWAELSRRVYAGGRQFDDTEDILEALNYEWDEMDLDYIRSLVSSIPNRIRECQLKGGRDTSY